MGKLHINVYGALGAKMLQIHWADGNKYYG